MSAAAKERIRMRFFSEEILVVPTIYAGRARELALREPKSPAVTGKLANIHCLLNRIKLAL